MTFPPAPPGSPPVTATARPDSMSERNLWLAISFLCSSFPPLTGDLEWSFSQFAMALRSYEWPLRMGRAHE